MPDKTPVTLDGGEPFISLHLEDANLAAISLPCDIGTTQLELLPGAYLAHFSTSAWTCQKSFMVIPGSTEKLVICPDDFESALINSAAPLRGTTNFVEADASLASGISKNRQDLKFNQGSLLLMARSHCDLENGNAEAGSLAEPHARTDFQLLTIEGRSVLDRTNVDGLKAETEGGTFCALTALPEGAYELRLAGAKAGSYVSQFLYIVARRQTQVFLLERSRPGGPRGVWATAKLSVHYADPANGFDADSKEALAAEEFINQIDAGRRPKLPAATRDKLLNERYPMLSLAFWLSQTDPWGQPPNLDLERVKELRDQLPGVPDAQVLCLAAALPDLTLAQNVTDGVETLGTALGYPPILGRSWDLALYAEANGRLRIVADSEAARRAESAVTVGPWLRFGASRSISVPDLDHAILSRDATYTGFSGPEFERFVRALRQRLREEMAARVQIGSAFFSRSERLFVELLCPEVDSTMSRIMQGAGGTVPEEIPKEQTIMEALRLPRAAIRRTADSALSKLFHHTLLPTADTLRLFVSEESELASLLRDPLRQLAVKPSKIFHGGMQASLPLLSLVFLRYRGSPAFGAQLPNNEQLARLLDSLGFRGPRNRPLRAADVESGFTAASKFLTCFYFEDPRQFGVGIWERIQIGLTPVHRYQAGDLCTISKRTVYSKAGLLQKESWIDNQFSYSVALLGARSDIAEIKETSERLTNEQYLSEVMNHGVSAMAQFGAMLQEAV